VGLDAEEADLLRELATRRRARRRRAAVIVLGLAALLVLAGCIYDSYWTRRLNAKLAQLRADGQILTVEELVSRHNYLPDEENSALGFLKARDALQKTAESDLLDSCRFGRVVGTLPSETVQGWLRTDLEANAEALRLCHEAARLPGGSYPLEPKSDYRDLQFPDVQGLRDLGRLCGREALLRAIQGDAAGAARSLVAYRRLAASFGERPVMIAATARLDLAWMAVGNLERIMGLCRMDEAALDALAREFELEERGLSLGLTLVSERSLGTDAFVRADVMLEKEGPIRRLAYGWVPGWRQKDALFFHGVMDQYAELTAAAPPEKVVKGIGIRDMVDREFWVSKWRYPLSAQTVPDMGSMFRDEAQSKAQLAMARTALLVEKWRMMHGRWPDSLEELVPDILETLPPDPFTEAPLVYRRTNEGILLYSVGQDGKDDKGLPAEEAVRRAGTLFVGEGWDLPLRVLDPQLRGAQQAALRDELMDFSLYSALPGYVAPSVYPGLILSDLRKVGLGTGDLKGLGLTDQDLEELKGRRW